MRRRQNNPILTGEAGVGKTAVVEGFAQRIADGDVPPPLRGVRLCMLDVGLMQAGASMKGEFEQRLRSVIDEVQNSPTPIILFIDEAHTLIGAGGSAGTGDAAKSAEACFGARHASHHRRNNLGGIPAVYREGSCSHASLPADPGRRAKRAEVLRHAPRHCRPDGKASQGSHFGRRYRGCGEFVQPLYSGSPAARQGRQSARYGMRTRCDQPKVPRLRGSKTCRF